MVDIFYKPPGQRPDECKALEENYMNCLIQKSMKDRVLVNKCVMDSILWFHTECPKAAATFDDPVEFKRKFRNFFAMTKSAADALLGETDTEKRLRREYGHVNYPEDIKDRVEYRNFPDEFRHLDPLTRPEDADEWDNEEAMLKPWSEDSENCDRVYGGKNKLTEVIPLSTSDSQKFGN